MEHPHTEHIVGIKSEDAKRLQGGDDQHGHHHHHHHNAKDFLKQTKVSALFPANRTRIITTTSGSPASEALETLIANNILSMPMWDEKRGQYTAFIDMLDIVVDVIGTLKDAEITGTGFLEILKGSEKLKKHQCGDVAGASGRNPFYPIEETAPLLAAMQLMVSNKVHRIAVISNAETNDLSTIVTQSHIAALILSNIALFKNIAAKTVKELKLGLKEVHCIEKNQPTVDGFKIIYDNKVTGVAVVENKELIGNISATDIKAVGANVENLSRLFWPAEEYVKLYQKTHEDEVIPPPFCVTPAATFEEVLTKLNLVKTHRVYVINEKSREPIGVISLSDVLECVLEHL